MRISIEIDTATLTPEDRNILSALSGGGHGWKEELATPAPEGQVFGWDGKPFRPATSVAHPGAPIDLSEGRAKEVPCLHYANEDGMCQRCGEQVQEGEPEKPKRKRRTKAEMEAARAAETAQEQPATEAPAAEQDETGQEDAPEPEAVSEAPEAAEETDSTHADGPPEAGKDAPRTIDKWREEAVAQATAAVAEGNRTKVKTALDAVGAKRVGELRDDQLAAFLGALKDA